MSNSDQSSDLICIGCGSHLQSENSSLSGYIPKSALKNSEETDLYCQRCFRLRHYNEVSDIELTDDDFLNMLHEIGEQDALIVNVIDLFDVEGTLVSGINRFAGSNPLLIVGNKADLIPHSVKRGYLRQWLTEQLHDQGIKPKLVDIISAKRSEDVKSLLQKIEERRQGRDVYIVGATNVGKSTLMNQIINIASSLDSVITTSYFPGTTLGKIEIPLSEGGALIDTPGIIKKTNMTHHLNAKELKYVIPKKQLKPSVYQLSASQTIFFSGLCRVDLVSSPDDQTLVGYFANELPRHRTKTEKAEEYYQSHIGELLVPPLEGMDSSLSPLKAQLFNLEEPADLVISGLGWVHIDKVPAKLRIWAPEGISVYKRRSMIG